MLRKYNTATTQLVPMIKIGEVNFATSSDWTPATGDVKVSKDGGAFSNISALPTAVGNMWLFSLTAIEMGAARIVVQVVDAATKAVEDQSFTLETYGNSSAQHEFDIDTATPTVNVTQLGGVVQSLTDLKHFADSGYDPVTSKVEGVKLVDTLTTYTSNTPQTGDTYALANGVNGFVAIDTAISGLNDLSQADITGGTYSLDTDANGRIRIVDGTGVGEIGLTGGAIDTVTTLTNLPTIPTNWLTATGLASDAVTKIQNGLSTHSASDIWSVATRVLTANINLNDPTAATIADAVWDEILSGHVILDSAADRLSSTLVSSDLTQLETDIGDALILIASLNDFDPDNDTVANVQSVAEVTGGINTVLGTITTLDGLDTAQDTQHSTTQALINALNDLSQADITGGAYALSTDANGRVRIVDGTGVGELDTLSGTVLLRAGTEASIAAIEDKTDQMTFSVANKLDSNPTPTAAICNKIADHIRRRTQANVEASSDGDTLNVSSLYGFIQQAQKSDVVGTNLVVLNPDGTILGTKPLTSDANANPITGIE